MDIGPSELIIVLVVVLVLFGGSKLPTLARNLGKAQAEFKKGLSGGDQDDDAAGKDAEPASEAEPAVKGELEAPKQPQPLPPPAPGTAHTTR